MSSEIIRGVFAGVSIVIGALSAGYGLETLTESPDLINDGRSQFEGGSTLLSGVLTMILAPYWAFKK